MAGSSRANHRPRDVRQTTRNLKVPLAAAALVVAVVGALLMARAGMDSDAVTDPVTSSSGPLASVGSGDVAGSDSWFLPDEPLLGFVLVPGGPFLMGSDPSVDPLAYPNERWSPSLAQGLVELGDFYVARYEVTVGQYGAFQEATGRGVRTALDAPPDHPITNVSWPDALAYAAWLNSQLLLWQGTPDALKQRLAEGWKITLPTEAQWEKAARGTDGRVFPWGDRLLDNRANLRSRGPRPVGSFPCPECPYGLRDLIGNVWEWTRSPLQPYPFDPTDDGNTLEADALWVMRGGGFGDTEQNARAATRGGADPGARRPFLGFRLVLSPE